MSRATGEARRARAPVRQTKRNRVSDELFRAAFDNSPAMQSIVRFADAVLVDVNDTFLRTLGFSRHEVIGKTPFELNFWVAPERLIAYRDQLQAHRRVRDFEMELRIKDGSLRTVLLSSEVVEFNGVQYSISAGIDITGRKRIEAELRNAEAELQRALARERELSQLKSDFVSLVSHEFRTPLEIIMSSADNLDRYHDRLPAEKREHLLRTINRSVRRMSGMMEEVLVLGRLETNRISFRPVPVDLRGFCQRLCDEIESTTARRCPIRLHITPSVETGDAYADESGLRHIFTNLLSNAVKYSSADLSVDFSLDREGDDLVCRIGDRGCGIPPADQKRLFQAFHRGSNVRQIPGTGLGLLIVQRCVELHRGEITFESTLGEGTVFTVRLPLYSANSQQTPGLSPMATELPGLVNP